jgi:hypothetical protein
MAKYFPFVDWSSIDRSSDIDDVRARQIGGDGRRAALINIYGARDQSLHCDGRADLINAHVKPTLGEGSSVQRNEERQTRCSGAGGTDFEASFLRLRSACLFRRAAECGDE